MTLDAEKREIFGKALDQARSEGKLPIVIYGAKESAASYFVTLQDFKKVWKNAGESTLVTLNTPTGKKEVIIHEIAFNPLTNEPIHADLLAVEANKPIVIHVQLSFVGEAPAEKLGLMPVKVLHELEVEALPKDLPHELVVDMSVLVDGESRITVGDIKLPAGVTTEVDPEEVVASVTEAGEEVVEEEAPADLSSIEVEKKGKAEEATAETEG